jgi:hypothetical protein
MSLRGCSTVDGREHRDGRVGKRARPREGAVRFVLKWFEARFA